MLDAIHDDGGPIDSRVLLLSPREREVLEMAAFGLTNEQVATRLHVTVHAVKFHLGSVYRKLGVTNRTEAAFVWLRNTAGDDATSEQPL